MSKIDKELAHELDKRNFEWVKVDESRPITGSDRKALRDGLIKTLEKLRKRPTIASVRRKRMNNLMYAWGEYAQPGGTSIRGTLGRIVDNPDYIDSSLEGYDRGISDHESQMISIGMLVSEMNADHKALVDYTYKDVLQDPVKAWCRRFGRTEDSYSSLKARILDKLIVKIL